MTDDRAQHTRHHKRTTGRADLEMQRPRAWGSRVIEIIISIEILDYAYRFKWTVTLLIWIRWGGDWENQHPPARPPSWPTGAKINGLIFSIVFSFQNRFYENKSYITLLNYNPDNPQSVTVECQSATGRPNTHTGSGNV